MCREPWISSYFGGGSGEYGRAIAVGPNGRVHFAGYTSSTDFPTLNPFQPELGGGSDCFIASIDLEQGGATQHIGDLDGLARNAGSGWRAGVRVQVHDEAEDPVADATVNFDVSSDTGAGPFPMACTTDADGICIVIIPRQLPANVGSVTFEVTDVTRGSRAYDPLGNHDPDGDSDGTTIEILQP